MKRFDELSTEEKDIAVNSVLHDIVRSLMDGSMTITLPHETHQRIMTGFLETGRKTGDFKRFLTFSQRSKLFRDYVVQSAEYSASLAFYAAPSEYVLFNIIDDENDDGMID